ncbi:MAG TPA: hypothetical protein PKD37_02005 [Oligoflexia bacterium]|nr:hypothetical protein [Oligoflexia bacterium]HMP26750.1 hypothetical protein [Oligoflexia bacterium]
MNQSIKAITIAILIFVLNIVVMADSHQGSMEGSKPSVSPQDKNSSYDGDSFNVNNSEDSHGESNQVENEALDQPAGHEAPELLDDNRDELEQNLNENFDDDEASDAGGNVDDDQPLD